MMTDETYSIHVGPNAVEIFGELTIEEGFDFLNFFEKKGYTKILWGIENTTLFLQKKEEIPQEAKNQFDQMCIWQGLYDEVNKENEKLRKKAKDLEDLMLKILEKKENDSCLKILSKCGVEIEDKGEDDAK